MEKVERRLFLPATVGETTAHCLKKQLMSDRTFWVIFTIDSPIEHLRCTNGNDETDFFLQRKIWRISFPPTILLLWKVLEENQGQIFNDDCPSAYRDIIFLTKSASILQDYIGFSSWMWSDIRSIFALSLHWSYQTPSFSLCC